ncbi:MAG: hypothetical protein ACJAS9_001988 [Polaribacter sp.]|jgi:hypothetical protein
MEPKQQILLDYLESKPSYIKEFDLMTDLSEDLGVEHGFFSDLGKSPSLFKKHFFLFHHLYLLSEVLLPSGRLLEISALSIKLIVSEQSSVHPEKKTKKKQLSESCAVTDSVSIELKTFYLEKNNLYLPDKEVQELLELFWKKYLSLDKKTDAIKCLGLQDLNNLSRSQIKRRYNQLAIQFHPDKGGDNIKFMQIKEAYEQLKALY